jgi:hypothetical protein
MSTQLTFESFIFDSLYHDGRNYAIHTENGDLVATIERQVSSINQTAKEKEFAIARLLAAAPAMYRALERCKTYLYTKYPKEADIFNEIEAVLSKVNGK